MNAAIQLSKYHSYGHSHGLKFYVKATIGAKIPCSNNYSHSSYTQDMRLQYTQVTWKQGNKPRSSISGGFLGWWL